MPTTDTDSDPAHHSARIDAADIDTGNIDTGDNDRKPAGSTATWVMTLFGTAVGAGILFLPLDAGKYGFIPLAFATVFILPLVYFSHRTYARIVSGAPKKDLSLIHI